MNASVEVVIGESKGVVLVPAEVLHELAVGQYAVFVIGAGGPLTMRPVEVGLRDQRRDHERPAAGRDRQLSIRLMERWASRMACQSVACPSSCAI